MDKDIIKARSDLYRNIRNFFLDKGYLEVETPTLSPDLIPEATIDNFSTTFINEFMGSREMYLIPSPEIFMKKLIANGSGSIFQISKCFRNCEQLGNIHNPEFSMLEYYSVGFDENDSIGLTQEFLKKTALENSPECVTSEIEVMTMRDAVKRWAKGTDIEELQNPVDLKKKAEELGLTVPEHESWDDTFNRIFLTFVETSLPKDHPVLLKDYPQQIECLAKREGNYRRRWEMYINGVEIANCYLEETDVETTRNYYLSETAKIAGERIYTSKVIPDADLGFADIFSTFPKCSGVAIGLDRLLMVQTGIHDINSVLSFPLASML